MADTEITKPMITLLVTVPVPAQRAGFGRRGRQSRALLVPLLLRVDVVAFIAIDGDLSGDCSIDLVSKSVVPNSALIRIFGSLLRNCT